MTRFFKRFIAYCALEQIQRIFTLMLKNFFNESYYTRNAVSLYIKLKLYISLRMMFFFLTQESVSMKYSVFLVAHGR